MYMYHTRYILVFVVYTPVKSACSYIPISPILSQACPILSQAGFGDETSISPHETDPITLSSPSCPAIELPHNSRSIAAPSISPKLISHHSIIITFNALLHFASPPSIVPTFLTQAEPYPVTCLQRRTHRRVDRSHLPVGPRPLAYARQRLPHQTLRS